MFSVPLLLAPCLFFLGQTDNPKENTCFIIFEDTRPEGNNRSELRYLKNQSLDFNNFCAINLAVASKPLKELFAKKILKEKPAQWISEHLEFEFITKKNQLKVIFNAADPESNLLILNEVALAFLEFTGEESKKAHEFALKIAEWQKENAIYQINSLLKIAKEDWQPSDHRSLIFLAINILKVSAEIRTFRAELDGKPRLKLMAISPFSILYKSKKLG